MPARRRSEGGATPSARLKAAMQALRSQPEEADARAVSSGVTVMLGELGTALLAASQATSDVEATLKRVALRYERPELQIFVLLTLVLVEDPAADPPGMSMFPAGGEALRLDQSGSVDRLVRRLLRDTCAPEAVVAELGEIRRARPRFGPVLTVLGYAILTVGFGLVLNPTMTALPVYAVLGAIVGLILLLGERLPTLSLILPVLTAFVVTLIIALVVRPFVHDDVLRLVAPSLVSFLPGLTLTIAAVELTTGQVMAGASRLVYGIARLGLLAFGVFAAISIAGPMPTPASTPPQLGGWAPWVGILLVSVGYFLYSAAPRGSFAWILFALLVAYGAQLAGDLMVGAELSGLIGAMLVIPAVYVAGRINSAPPTAVMLTCAYWLLVPGSMGFIGLTEAAAGTAGASEILLRTFGSLVAIAIGMLLGTGLCRDVMAVSRGWRAANDRARSGP